MTYASLCFLSYNRPAFINEAINSALDNAMYPCEVIVHDDGSVDPSVRATLTTMLDEGKIGELIFHPPGHNVGVGRSINRMFKLATGDPIIKLDQDLVFVPGWLARVVEILRNDHAVGMLGLFKYPIAPVAWHEMKIPVNPPHGGYHYTRQFCGSGFAIPRVVYEQLGELKEYSDAFAEDIEYMERVRNSDLELALPDTDLVTNRGFGIGPSTVVEEGHVVHKIHHGPYVLDSAEANGDQESALTPSGSEIDPDSDEQTPGSYQSGDLGNADGPSRVGLPAPVTASAQDFKVGVVITTCAGREENLQRVIDHLMRLHHLPETVVVVYDGCPAQGFVTPQPIFGVEIPKHTPGQEQPRNVGFRELRRLSPECNYVWFLDSDLIFDTDILDCYEAALKLADRPRILIGPYDWLRPGVVEFVRDRHDNARLELSDYRWVSFDRYNPDDILVHDLGAGLANFGGNLVWPVEGFEKVGGFHPELHHGRCEDGELGLRAASAGIPMSFVRDARAWHVWHTRNVSAVEVANQRDVPLLNQWHPWVAQQGLVVTHEDGARFEWDCPDCDQRVNSLAYWEHSESHKETA